jgi:hypothetical protein
MAPVHSVESNLLLLENIIIFVLAKPFHIGIVGANRSTQLNVKAAGRQRAEAHNAQMS